jgi:hypothetical protein
MTATIMSGPPGSVFFSALPDAPRPAAKDYIQFAVTDSAPRWSREFTARFLAPVPAEAAGTAVLLVSELVANAVQAARPRAGRCRPGSRPGSRAGRPARR